MHGGKHAIVDPAGKVIAEVRGWVRVVPGYSVRDLPEKPMSRYYGPRFAPGARTSSAAVLKLGAAFEPEEGVF